MQKLNGMRRPGIEPGPRAWKARILTIELSMHVKHICRLPGSNRGPSDLQSDALPAEL